MRKLAMREDEIAASYRQAKNRRQQIGILAELNDVPKEAICKILEKRGLLQKKRIGEKRRDEITASAGRPIIWTEEMDERLMQMLSMGMRNEEVAKAMGRTEASIKGRKCILRGMGYEIERQKGGRK